MILFQTPRLLVRHWELPDIENLFALYSDPAVMQFIRATLTLEETQSILTDHINKYSTDPYEGRFAVIEKKNGGFIGTFLLKNSDSIEGKEIGYAFLQASWGQGLATELVQAGVAFAFDTVGLQQLYAITEINNEGSKNVLRKCGFRQMENIFEHEKEMNLFVNERSLTTDFTG